MLGKMFGRKPPTRTVDQIVFEAIDSGSFFVDLDGTQELNQIAKAENEDPRKLNDEVAATLLTLKTITEMMEKLLSDGEWVPALQNVFEDYAEHCGVNYELVDRCLKSLAARKPELFHNEEFSISAWDEERGRRVVQETDDDRDKIAALRTVLFDGGNESARETSVPEEMQPEPDQKKNFFDSGNESAREESVSEKMQRELDQKRDQKKKKGSFDINWETVTPAEVKNRIDEGFDPNQRKENGGTPLMYAAAINGNPEVLKTLLDAGADVSARSTGGQTPLMSAARLNGNPGVVKTLLDAGADLSARDPQGQTALMYAAAGNDNPEVVLLLLQAGAHAAAKDNSGETAWDKIQENKAMKDTQAYWKLNDLRFE